MEQVLNIVSDAHRAEKCSLSLKTKKKNDKTREKKFQKRIWILQPGYLYESIPFFLSFKNDVQIIQSNEKIK